MGTVTKALSLLRFFTRQRPEIGLSDLARLSGINKATVYRLMTELAQEGFVEQTPSGKSYRIGAEVLRLAALREAAVPLLEVARGLLRDLSEEIGETAHLSIVQGTRLNALAHHYSTRHGTRVTMEDAERLSFHATASGLAILAFADDALRDAVLVSPLTAHTAHTETDPARIRDRLAAIRQEGLAESVGGFEADVHSVAAPVFGADGRPLGALAIAVPVARMTDDMIAFCKTRLIRDAAALTRRIGGFAPTDTPFALEETIR